MEELNVFGTRIFLALGFCLTVFYLLGSVLVGHFKNPFASVGAKLSLGGLFFISILAAAHAGIQTGMLFFAFLFLLMGIKNRFRPDFSDLKELGLLKVSIILACFFTLLLEEGYRSDLLVDGAIYVGNSDVSFYSAYGHFMYGLGYETNPENLTPEMRGSIYHFGDLWFSGFFSNYFHILPYYAYNVLFRVFALGVIILTVFGWCHQFSKQAWSAFLVAITAVLAVYMELFPLNLPDNIALLRTFSSTYAAYGLGSHLIVGMAVVPFSLYLVEKNWLLGTCGLLLIPFLNAGLLLVPVIAMLLLVLVFIAQKIFRKDLVPLNFGEVLLLLFVSAVPLIYYVLGDRLDSSTSDVRSLHFIYLFLHTGVRTLLSQVLVIPFILGLIWYGVSQHTANRKLFIVQLVFYIGTSVGFAFIFPQIQGNSTQILSMHFAGFLAPMGLIGLYAMFHTSQKLMLKWVAGLFLIAIISHAAWVFLSSEGQRATFDWESYQPGYQQSHTVGIDEWKQISSLLKKDRTVFAYFNCTPLSDGGTFYNSFTYLKCLYPGAIFQRINPKEEDAQLSRESQNRHNRTTLGYFALKNRDNAERTEKDMIAFLSPDYVLVSNNSDLYCVPSRWDRLKTAHSLKTHTFTFYKQ